MDVWRAMVAAQGGDPDAPLPRAATVDVVAAPASGVVTRLDARAVGIAAWRLGAGRARKEDPVSAAAGVVCRAKVGDLVQKGEPLLELHTDDPARLPAAHDALVEAVDMADRPGTEVGMPLVLERIDPALAGPGPRSRR
jgi:thymidine phosphorylase